MAKQRLFLSCSLAMLPRLVLPSWAPVTLLPQPGPQLGHILQKCILPETFFSCGTGAWTQGLHLQPFHQAFFVRGFFQDRISRTIYVGWLWTAILLISASWVGRITDVSHWSPAQAETFNLHFAKNLHTTTGHIWRQRSDNKSTKTRNPLFKYHLL
jgi:hypothetical protein